jgi:hypothetical protein
VCPPFAINKAVQAAAQCTPPPRLVHASGGEGAPARQRRQVVTDGRETSRQGREDSTATVRAPLRASTVGATGAGHTWQSNGKSKRGGHGKASRCSWLRLFRPRLLTRSPVPVPRQSAPLNFFFYLIFHDFAKIYGPVQI